MAATLESLHTHVIALTETVQHLVTAVESLAEQKQTKTLDFSSIAGHQQHELSQK